MSQVAQQRARNPWAASGLPAVMLVLCGWLLTAMWVVPLAAQESQRRPGRAEMAERTGDAEDERFEEEEVETDRDSFTPATTTVDLRRAIVESSYSLIENRHKAETHSLPELLIRYGLSRRLEMRVGWNYEVGGGGSEVSGGEFLDEDPGLEREAQFLYGFKYLTSTQVGLRPQSALLVQGFTPSEGHETSSQMAIGEVWGWRFANGWVWDSAIRFATDRARTDNFTQWAPSSVIKAPVGERGNVHLEYFGIYSNGKATNFDQHFVSFGPHWLLTRNLELGLRVGFGLNQQSARFFSNAGLGVRF